MEGEKGEREREMLTCIACSKQLNTNNGGSKKQEEDEEEDRVIGTPRSKQAVKSLTSQVDKTHHPMFPFHELSVRKKQKQKLVDGTILVFVGFCLRAKNKLTSQIFVWFLIFQRNGKSFQILFSLWTQWCQNHHSCM